MYAVTHSPPVSFAFGVEKVFLAITISGGWDSWFTDGMTLDLENKKISFKWVDFGGDHIDCLWRTECSFPSIE